MSEGQYPIAIAAQNVFSVNPLGDATAIRSNSFAQLFLTERLADLGMKAVDEISHSHPPRTSGGAPLSFSFDRFRRAPN